MRHSCIRLEVTTFLVLLLFSCGEHSRDIGLGYAGSKTCQPCHATSHRIWAGSNHALAERAIDEKVFQALFSSETTLRDSLQSVEIQFAHNRVEISTQGISEMMDKFIPERIIGVDPITQFLIPARGGRMQVSDMAYHPNAGALLSVFGDGPRQPGEWGHWTGRGMNWNSRCAACHNTGVQKNYIDSTDTYTTSLVEMGVTCEACHGGLADHVNWQTNHPKPDIPDPTVQLLAYDQIQDLCASCHSRRTEITGEFVPGAKFLDHYVPIIPDETDIYFPDGQVHEENYESMSFLGSKMYTAKVSCIDCHDSKVTETGNELCNKCHNGQRAPLAAHSFHPAGMPGSNCVDCHMPQTVFMQSDPRHDHGFTIPDPKLTQEYGVPNACNRCHKDKSVEWSTKYVLEWYGDTSQRYSQQRARWIARARKQDESDVINLIAMVQNERNPLWRAVAVGLLKNWVSIPDVKAVVVEKLKDEHPLVRTYATRSLALLADMQNASIVKSLMQGINDSLASVRVEAAWALRAIINDESPAGKELLQYLKFNADQPTGALRLGLFHIDRGASELALPYLERAVSWDPSSAPLRYAYAVCLGENGQTEKSMRQLEKACLIAPEDSNLWFYYGLVLNEIGRLGEAVESFETATEITPEFVRAWYNLGLAYRDMDQPEKALRALENAEKLEPSQAYIPYARATILWGVNEWGEAENATRKALGLDSSYQQALHLLEFLTEENDNRVSKK